MFHCLGAFSQTDVFALSVFDLLMDLPYSMFLLVKHLVFVQHILGHHYKTCVYYLKRIDKGTNEESG